MGNVVDRRCNREWDAGQRVGGDYGVVEPRSLFPAFPSFSSFAGKSWESEYPRVLVAYYGACGGTHGKRLLDAYEAADGVDVVHGVEVSRRFLECAADFARDIGVRVGDSGDVRCVRGDVVDGSVENSTSSESHRDCVSSEAGVASRDVGVGLRGPHYERNKKNREEQKLRKAKRKAMNVDWRKGRETVGNCLLDVGDHSRESFLKSCPVNARQDLIASKAKMHVARNELEALRAERQLQILKASDIQEEVKQYRTKVCAATERSMVSIEKTHSQLRASGDLIDGGSRVCTVVSDGVPSLSLSGSGSISPDSSASQAEFRAVQKALADCQFENERYKNALGCSIEVYEMKEKSQWTFGEKNDAILDQLYPDGFGYCQDGCDDGKFRPV